MIRFEILTLFPSMVEFYIDESIIKRAINAGVIDVKVLNIRDFTSDRHKCVDDYPYGGGAGMVMKVEPVYNALEYIKRAGQKLHVILLTPQGDVFDQQRAEALSKCGSTIVLICGRYEGFDERIRDIAHEELSIGNYVLTGGELPALAVMDSVSRLVPGVLGDFSSSQEESFTTGRLDYPAYTRPPVFRGRSVPEILLSGNHEKIRQWRKKEALRKTYRKKPYLLKTLTQEDKTMLTQIKEEEYNGFDECR